MTSRYRDNLRLELQADQFFSSNSFCQSPSAVLFLPVCLDLVSVSLATLCQHQENNASKTRDNLAYSALSAASNSGTGRNLQSAFFFAPVVVDLLLTALTFYKVGRYHCIVHRRF